MDSPESREWARLAFVENRDGMASGLAFAGQGIGQYGAAIHEAEAGGNQYGASYRDSLLASLRVYRQYLEQHKAPA